MVLCGCRRLCLPCYRLLCRVDVVIMDVKIEEINALIERLRELNSKPLESVRIFENGKRVKIDPRVLKAWRFTGLSNFDFFRFDIHKKGFDEVEWFCE